MQFEDAAPNGNKAMEKLARQLKCQWLDLQEEALSSFYRSVGQPEKASLEQVRGVLRMEKWRGATGWQGF